MTNPESQKTGIETTHPISSIANTGLFFPTSFITISASFNAAPVFSRTELTNSPKMITMPILEKVPENPAPITLARPLIFVPSSSVLSTNGIPATRPNRREINIIARNGCTLNLEIAIIITTTASTKTKISGNLS